MPSGEQTWACERELASEHGRRKGKAGCSVGTISAAPGIVQQHFAWLHTCVSLTWMLASFQVSRLEHAKESLQADMADARAKLAALEARFQQHLAECSGRQAAAAEKEASLELACRQARNEASVAR